MTKVINALSQMRSLIRLVRCDLRHGEIGLAQHYALRVDSDENFRDGFDVEVSIQFNQTKLLVLNLLETLDAVKNFLLRNGGILGTVIADHFEDIQVRSEQFCDVWQPTRVLQDGRVLDFELLFY